MTVFGYDKKCRILLKTGGKQILSTGNKGMVNSLQNLKVQALRNNEYYDTQQILDKLYEKSKAGKKFNDLMRLIMSETNILNAYRNIKSNKGSMTAGCDGRTIADLEMMSTEDFLSSIKNSLLNYQPNKVRRVEIPKPNGQKRPLGIPTIKDRIIQQSIRQVLEPICEAKFYKHSYGFRPGRSAGDAIARFMFLVNQVGLHYVVDVDIKSFFDEVNHSKLIRQLWTMGIHDKALLNVIIKILKSEIAGIGKPTKGTPQGGLISPLLSNVVLNELDWWVASQWENMPTKHQYSRQDSKYLAFKTSTNLKECYIVRYADDFKILCRDYESARKLFTAVRMWLKERLGLKISCEKSRITRLRKEHSEFLGFKLKVVKKGKQNGRKTGTKDKFVINSHISNKALAKICDEHKKHISKIQKATNKLLAISKANSYILGVHNYYSIATHCCKDFARINACTRTTVHNRLRPRDIKDRDKIPKYMIKLGYSKSSQLRMVCGKELLPIGFVRTRNAMCSSQLCIYIPTDRRKIHTDQQAVSNRMLQYLVANPDTGRSTKYNDNRISLFVAQYGKCAVTGMVLIIGEMECHHKKPLIKGGNDEYNNLIWVSKDIHKVIHATHDETISVYLSHINLTARQRNKLNELRKKAGNQPV